MSHRHHRVFNRYLKKYQSGQLLNNEAKRDKRTMYDEVKEKLLQYIELQCGQSWALLREKALFFADELGFGDDFKASDGWIQSVLKAGGKKSVSLHGEGMEMTEEEQVGKHKDFVKVMRQTMEDFNIPLEWVYNADQTGLFYNKLPNQMYVSAARKDYRVVKQMKSKDRVTLIHPINSLKLDHTLLPL